MNGRLFRPGVGLTEPAVAMLVADNREYLHFVPEVPPETQALWGYPWDGGMRPAREVGS